MRRVMIALLSPLLLVLRPVDARAQAAEASHPRIVEVPAALRGGMDPRLLTTASRRAATAARHARQPYDIYAMDPYMTWGGLIGAGVGLVVGAIAMQDGGLESIMLPGLYAAGGMILGMVAGAGVYFLVERDSPPPTEPGQ